MLAQPVGRSVARRRARDDRSRVAGVERPVRVRQGSVTVEVWGRPLAEGTRAMALFNRGLQAATVSAPWSDIGVTGRQPVRDLWQQSKLGSFSDRFAVRVPAHGGVLIKVGTPWGEHNSAVQ